MVKRLEEDLIQLKEWLRIDGEDEDNALSSLLISSEVIIEESTGVKKEDIEIDEKVKALYTTIRNMIITDLYENRTGSPKISPVLVSLYKKLEAKANELKQSTA